jgi:hypothetical protein
MAVSFGTYYINAETFSDATAVFTSSSLNTLAADGTYQFGGVYRVQTNGVLGVPFTCMSCCEPCGTSLAPRTYSMVGNGFAADSLNDRLHSMCTYLNGIRGGAIVIEFDFLSGVANSGFPLGLEGVYNSVSTTGVVSRRYGWLPNRYVGDSNEMSDAQLNNSILIGDGPYELTDVSWDSEASAFIIGTTTTNEPPFQPLPLPTLSTSLTVNNPEKCYMIIPNSTVGAENVTAKVYSPRPRNFGAAGALDVTVNCPSALTGFEASNVSATRAGACGLNTRAATLYNMPVNGTAGVPRLFDRVFTTSNGTSLAAEGFYALNQNTSLQTSVYDWIHVDANGVVVAKGVGCGGTLLTEVISSEMRTGPTLACTAPTPNQTYYHNGAGDAPVAGDIMYSDSAGTLTLSGGYYQSMRNHNVVAINAGLPAGEVLSITNPC